AARELCWYRKACGSRPSSAPPQGSLKSTDGGLVLSSPSRWARRPGAEFGKAAQSRRRVPSPLPAGQL
ncbi:hypothetical protein DBR06_SOUSAS28010011, partial [Sousa chinensis]